MLKNIILILIWIGLAWSRNSDVSFPLLGTIKPRPANEIEDNNWSIGAETMDRDYTIYKNWCKYLGPLGFKHARIQAGWMKTEPKKGVYHFSWLDEIIFDMHRQGVKPWMNLAWGNRHYAEWTANNRGRVPKTEAGLKAWVQFVQALVVRYGHIIDEWEIWNEASPSKIENPADYVTLVQRTIPAIRSLQPNAKIMILAMDHYTFKTIRPKGVFFERDSLFRQERMDYVTFIMDRLQELNLLAQVDVISYHPYEYNPDKIYPHVAWLRQWATDYAPHLKIYQGENGAPSERIEYRGLRGFNWNETSQAKWALRRLLGDLGRDIPSSYFGMMDMFYQEDINRKGLLHANPDKTVHHAKEAYYALQNLAAVFDHRLQRINRYTYAVSKELPLSVFGYENKFNREQVVTIWRHDDIPSGANKKTMVDFIFYAGKFSDPVYVDLRGGQVYAIPDNNWSHEGTVYHFTSIPVYDSPILVAGRNLIHIEN